MALRAEQYGSLVEALVVDSAGITSKIFIKGDEYGSLHTTKASRVRKRDVIKFLPH